jgi:broad specificity phosphatase PhoE
MFDKATMDILPSSSVLRVHLFRHGHVSGSRLCRGQADVTLSDQGLLQTARTADWFRRRQPAPDRVISSDLGRCRNLAEAFGSPVQLERALREQDMGLWDGRPWEELTKEDPAGTLEYWNDYVRARPPGGESYGDCFSRVTGWWDQEAPKTGAVVVVTHVGVIRALMCHWLGLPVGDALRWAPPYASHTQVLLAEAGAVVERFGETAYLD